MRTSFLFFLAVAFCRVETCISAESPLIADAKESYYWSTTNCCGLVAVYVIENSLEKSQKLDHLAEELPVSANGTSMLAMVKHLRNSGLQAEGISASVSELSWQLKHRNYWAIAMIDHGFGYHWVATQVVDPNSFTFFNYPKWETVDKARFSEMYTGKAILVHSNGGGHFDPRLLGPVLFLVPCLGACLFVFRFARKSK